MPLSQAPALPLRSEEQITSTVGSLEVTTVPARESADGLWHGSVWASSEDALFVATSPDETTVRQILASAFEIPRDHVAIPYDPDASLVENIRQMRSAGLEVRAVIDRDQSTNGLLISTEPALGSVVPAQATVTVIVAGSDGGPDSAP
jgi:hypothetical protein